MLSRWVRSRAPPHPCRRSGAAPDAEDVLGGARAAELGDLGAAGVADERAVVRRVEGEGAALVACSPRPPVLASPTSAQTGRRARSCRSARRCRRRRSSRRRSRAPRPRRGARDRGRRSRGRAGRCAWCRWRPPRRGLVARLRLDDGVRRSAASTALVSVVGGVVRARVGDGGEVDHAAVGIGEPVGGHEVGVGAAVDRRRAARGTARRRPARPRSRPLGVGTPSAPGTAAADLGTGGRRSRPVCRGSSQRLVGHGAAHGRAAHGPRRRRRSRGRRAAPCSGGMVVSWHGDRRRPCRRRRCRRRDRRAAGRRRRRLLARSMAAPGVEQRVVAERLGLGEGAAGHGDLAARRRP